MQRKTLEQLRVELRQALDKMMFNDVEVDSIKSISKLIRDDGRVSIYFIVGYDKSKNAIKTEPLIFGRKREDNTRQLKSVFNFELLWLEYRFMSREFDSKSSYREMEDIEL